MEHRQPTKEELKQAKGTMIKSGVKLIVSLIILYIVYLYFKGM